jgi:hypothetical protein
MIRVGSPPGASIEPNPLDSDETGSKPHETGSKPHKNRIETA